MKRTIMADLKKWKEKKNRKPLILKGARQVGKTTLAIKLIAPVFKEFAYYNWDARSDRKKIMSSEFPGSAKLIIFDEIHKYPKWKNLINYLLFLQHLHYYK